MRRAAHAREGALGSAASCARRAREERPAWARVRAKLRAKLRVRVSVRDGRPACWKGRKATGCSRGGRPTLR
eukprot:scaffold116663_cov30-Phaeocystis_antarctica.AAC.1